MASICHVLVYRVLYRQQWVRVRDQCSTPTAESRYAKVAYMAGVCGTSSLVDFVILVIHVSGCPSRMALHGTSTQETPWNPPCHTSFGINSIAACDHVTMVTNQEILIPQCRLLYTSP